MRISGLLKIGISFSVAIFLVNFSTNEVFAQTAVLPNEMGMIPVMEYHRIGQMEREWTRSSENFKKDLEWYYANDYRLITAADFIDQKIDVPYGKKPMMMTFDDSTDSQFKYLENGEIDPNCAIGLLDDFLKKHPDFGRGGTFFVLPAFFEQKDLKKKKLEYLLSTGREIGNHTVTHPNLAKMSGSQIEAELGGLVEKVNELAGREILMESLAYPFGGMPKREALNAVIGGKLNKTEYKNKAAFLVGADPAFVPYRKKFNALKIPRIQANDAEFKRWFGREAGEIGKTDKEIFEPFISDGNKDVLTIPIAKAGNLDKTKAREGVKVCEYKNEEEMKGCLDQIPNSKFQIPNKLQITNSKIETSRNEAAPRFYEGGELVNINAEKAEKQILNLEVRLKKGIGTFLNWFKKMFPDLEARILPAGFSAENGKFYYTVKETDTLAGIVNYFLWITKYYLPSELEAAIKTENNLINGKIKAGDKIIMPGIELMIWHQTPKIDFKKGIYWTGYTAGGKEAINLMEKLKQSGGNMVVFDIKEIEGSVFFEAQDPLVQSIGSVNVKIGDLKKLVRILHNNGIYVVARQVLFKDVFLAKKKPEWAPKNKNTGRPWANNEGVVWMDPSRPEVQDYNLAIAKDAAGMGVDEIQFDYIRFPERGDIKSADYYFDESKQTKEDIIADFLAKAYKELKPFGVRLGADLFGIVAWSNGVDARILGQNISRMAENLDVIYPMAYPSHFGPGYAGHANPGGEPYFFVNESCKKFMKLMEGKGTEIMPWIQGFSWRATGFGTNYVKEQIKAAMDLNLPGFVIWSAGNKYDVSWGALK